MKTVTRCPSPRTYKGVYVSYAPHVELERERAERRHREQQCDVKYLGMRPRRAIG
jgi:hypothetical protein